MSAKITLPVANGKTKISSFMETVNSLETFIVVSVVADQPLILNVNQAYDEDFFDYQDAELYDDVGNETSFEFPRVGNKAYFTLTNTSGTDCTITRAFAEYRNQTSSNVVAINGTLPVQDADTRNQLEVLNNNISLLNQSIVNLQKQSPVYYREQGEAYYVTSPEFNASLQSVNEFLIYNPPGSNKTIYLYNVSFFSKAPPGLDYSVTIRADKLNSYTGGVNVPNNLKGNLSFGLTNESPAELVTKPDDIITLGRVFNKKLNNEADSNLVLFNNEFLEIPPGLGLSFSCFASAETVNVGINLRYFETFRDAPPQSTLRSIIPDVDPQGNPIRTQEPGLNVYTWEFTTSDETLYDLFSITNEYTTQDDEYITKLYLANDQDETNLLNDISFATSGGITLLEDISTGEFNMLFAPEMVDSEVPQANITLLPNTRYAFKVRTLFNDQDEGSENAADIRLAIVARATEEVLDLDYVNVAIAS